VTCKYGSPLFHPGPTATDYLDAGHAGSSVTSKGPCVGDASKQVDYVAVTPTKPSRQRLCSPL
jgi:hypothetical protein